MRILVACIAPLMRSENRGGVFELLLDGNRSELVAERAAQKRKFLACFARLITQREMQIDGLIIRRGLQRLAGLFASFAAQKKKRGFSRGLRVAFERRENCRGLAHGKRRDA